MFEGVCIFELSVLLYGLKSLNIFPERTLRNHMSSLNAKLKRGAALVLVGLVALFLCACGAQVYIDPHVGMVSVSDGRGGEMWVKRYENIPASSFSADEFYSDGTYIDYDGKQYRALRGIDVSEHQGVIDWQAVRDDGVEFAIIRAGYRGYSAGELFEDSFFRTNIEGAKAAGLKVGIYFFSQAVDRLEATEEAEYLLSIIVDYDLDMPVFFDWEKVAEVGETRVDEVDGTTITDCCLAFCSTIESAGHTAGVYFYRSLGYYDYELDRLTNLVFWVGAPGDTPDFYYRHAMWQYSFTGTVGGIACGTDLNLLFEEIPACVQSAAPSVEPSGIIPPEVTLPSSSD